MNQLASELNKTLDETVAGRLLSDLGRRIYFPKGIISQSAEAKKDAYFANATIGMACDQGKPVRLSVFEKQFPQHSENESVAYAPTAGVEPLRSFWKEQILKKNGGLAGSGAEDISLPVIVPGITAGISYAADLFLSAGDHITAFAPYWDNYSLIFEQRRGAAIDAVSFGEGGLGGACEAIQKRAQNKDAFRVILNFPNNPTGYSPDAGEARRLADTLGEAAAGGTDTLVICDDAYFGLFYEENTHKKSIFELLSKTHERLLAVKIDGPTKEDYVWGLRLAAVTFAGKGLDGHVYAALEKKMAGLIRSSVSCANTPSQYALLKANNDKDMETEKQRYFNILKSRYLAVKRFIAENECPPCIEPVAFNSGYFMSFRMKGVSAETLRVRLLKEQGIGTVAFGDDFLRVAFASIETAQIETVYRKIYETSRSAGGPHPLRGKLPQAE